MRLQTVSFNRFILQCDICKEVKGPLILASVFNRERKVEIMEKRRYPETRKRSAYAAAPRKDQHRQSTVDAAGMSRSELGTLSGVTQPYDESAMQLVRQEIYPEKMRLQKEAKEAKERLKMRASVDPVLTKIRLIMNVITPDNFISQQSELARLMMENPEENIEKTVECIFKKAWAEEKYAKTYVELCKHLIETEISQRGEKLPKGEEKKNKLIKSRFR